MGTDCICTGAVQRKGFIPDPSGIILSGDICWAHFRAEGRLVLNCLRLRLRAYLWLAADENDTLVYLSIAIPVLQVDLSPVESGLCKTPSLQCPRSGCSLLPRAPAPAQGAQPDS